MESTQTSLKNELSYVVLNEPTFDYKKIVSARLANFLTQEDLAIICGVSVNTISAIECGKFVPRVKLFYKICCILKLMDFDVLYFPDPMYIKKKKVL